MEKLKAEMIGALNICGYPPSEILTRIIHLWGWKEVVAFFSVTVITEIWMVYYLYYGEEIHETFMIWWYSRDLKKGRVENKKRLPVVFAFIEDLYERVRVWSGLPPMKKDNVADGEAEEGE